MRFSLNSRIVVALLLSLTCGLNVPAARANDLDVSVFPASHAGGTYNAVAVWDPVAQRACLYGQDIVHIPFSPSDSWLTASSCTTWQPEDLPSGIYDLEWGTSKALLVASASPASTSAHMLVIVPDYTWVAYDINANGNFYTPTGPARVSTMSLLRPLSFDVVNVEVQPADRLARYPGVNPIDFLRNAGNIVDVVAQSQLDSLSYTLSNYQTIVMYGHDEYWTPSLRATLETAVTGGVSLLNLSGNTGYRRILRSGTSISYETPNRWGARPGETTVQQLLCAKFLGFPFNRVHDISQPLTKKEYQALLNDGLPRTIAKKKVYRYLRGMRVTSLESGLFAGTTLQVGSWFGTKSEVLFIEADGIPLTHSGQPETSFLAGFSAPGVTSFSAESWMQKRTKRRYHARTGFLIVGKYGTGNVFTAGSIGWVNAIVKGDINVRQITLNALNKISISSTPDPNPPV